MKKILLDKSEPLKIKFINKTFQNQDNVSQKEYYDNMPTQELEILIFNVWISEIFSMTWKENKDNIELIFKRTNGKKECFFVDTNLLAEIRAYLRGSKVKIVAQTNMFG